MKTARGVCLNLKDSTYSFKIYNYTLYFSSLFYLEKFKEGLQDFIEMESKKLEIRFKINLILERYLIIAYYMKIEKRGFRLVVEDIKGVEEYNQAPDFEVIMC